LDAVIMERDVCCEMSGWAAAKALFGRAINQLADSGAPQEASLKPRPVGANSPDRTTARKPPLPEIGVGKVRLDNTNKAHEKKPADCR
jgi:hypothetical protein